METNFQPHCKKVTRFDLGWTEDEYNDFLIDCHIIMSELKKQKEIINLPVVGEPITITISEKDYYNPST